MDLATTDFADLRRLLKNAPSFMAVLIGPEHEFAVTNDAYLQLVGHRDLIGLTVREALPEVEGQGFFELLDQVYRTGEPFVGNGVEIALQSEPGGPLMTGFLNFIYQPMIDAAGRVSGIFVEGHDVTAQKLAEDEAELARLKVQLALEAADIGIWEAVVKDGRLEAFSGDERAASLLGHASANDPEMFFRAAPEYRDELSTELQRLISSKGDKFLDSEVCREVDDNDTVQWVHLRAQLIRRLDSSRLVGTVRDITDQKEAETRQTMLRNELAHRIKNTLAMVTAIASQTFRGKDLSSARSVFSGRIMALSSAQDVFMAQTGEQRSMDDVVAKTLRPHAAAERFRIEGPKVLLGPRQTVSFALAVHELATNSVKYGALSNETGTVDIRWTVEDGTDGQAELRWVWTESGGPEIGEIADDGFGSKLIKHSLATEIGGTVGIEFRSEGVVCEATAPTSALS
ncbi:sensor histidine kinase [Notoacmeibacter sp. MSK16QG-6]|uniref:sensor histidine kinase n=1 Tax=Notoacmeibacter sp. MSK16QG-6 TaxID=2957982 RepID=UPI0020A0FCA7|nr:HWE histidine kinase domain-containing protein [Notoacmeibacter sp. MSK16QG-6]MCP1200996.1 PAS domain-containing protein [Notoacmeibacter sp. MSK16QG-6]